MEEEIELLPLIIITGLVSIMAISIILFAHFDDKTQAQKYQIETIKDEDTGDVYRILRDSNGDTVYVDISYYNE